MNITDVSFIPRAQYGEEGWTVRVRHEGTVIAEYTITPEEYTFLQTTLRTALMPNA